MQRLIRADKARQVLRDGGRAVTVARILQDYNRLYAYEGSLAV